MEKRDLRCGIDRRWAKVESSRVLNPVGGGSVSVSIHAARFVESTSVTLVTDSTP